MSITRLGRNKKDTGVFEMKLTILATINLIALSAFAQLAEKPFALDAGKYSETCHSVGVTKVDGKLDRQFYNSEGQVSVVKRGDVTIETSNMQDEDFSSTSTVRTETKDLGNSRFEVSYQTYSTMVFDGKVTNTSTSYVVVVKVEDNLTLNESIVLDGKKRENLVGETNWKKFKDGRILVQSYQREPTMIERKMNDGTIVSVHSLSQSSTCLYKKLD